jgi:molecular chaperone DnaK (HSP70)
LDEPFVDVHSVVDVTAKYLTKLKDTAEYFLSGKVDGCVISIPAHFEEKQKKALVKACNDAGFKFAYPIHEPVAACLAFNASVLKENANPDKEILVLDLGAESFNISLVSSHDGLYTIEDSVEELNLGGISFDKVLFDYAKDDFQKKTKLDISDNKRSVAKLMNACELTKRSLSRQDTAPCSVESLCEGMDYNGTVLRGRFEMLSEGLLSRCKEVVLKCLKKSEVTPESLGQVLLVGGSSRIPSFQKAMKSLFPNVDSTTEFRTEVEPDEAITIGCAVQAALLNNDFNIDFAPAVIEADHVGKSIGVKAADGKFQPIIPKGTPLPVRREFSLPLPSSQTSVYLEICELEKDGSMEVLAEVGLSGIPATVKSGKVEVVFLIESDHLMSVSVTEKVSGESVHAVLH